METFPAVRFTGRKWRVSLVGCVLGASSLLAACVSGPTAPAVQAVPLVAISVADLEGNWGLASYRTEADKERTITEAKSACSNPYVITKGGVGGVMMYLADQAQPQEVVIKVAQNGQVYIGLAGKPGIATDRLVLSFADGVLITQWVDPGTAERFGTMILVRCKPKTK